MNYFRKRYAEKEWTKKVDISTIFNLKKATAEIKRLSENKPFSNDETFERVLKEVETLENNLAVANGEVKKINLKKHEMPEDKNPAEYRKPLQEF